jgi:hypothetical protein
MTITLHEADCGTFLLVAGSGHTRLVQLDWDLPTLAATFGCASRSQRPSRRCQLSGLTVLCRHQRGSAEAHNPIAANVRSATPRRQSRQQLAQGLNHRRPYKH